MSVKTKAAPRPAAKTVPKAAKPPAALKAGVKKAANSDSFDELLDRLASHLIWRSQNRARDIAAIKQMLRQVEAGVTPKASPKRAVRPAQGRKATMGKQAPKSGSTLTVERPLSASLKSLLAAVLDQPEKWMATPNHQFGGRKPGELVGTPEETKIFALLHAVDQGLF